MTDYSASVEELKGIVDAKQTIIQQRDDEINRLTKEIQVMKDNPPVSKLEGEINSIVERSIQNWFDNHGNQYIQDIVDDLDIAEDEIKSVVSNMNFEISSDIEVW